MYSFSQFWSDYPRKIHKREAEKAWNTAIKKGVDPLRVKEELLLSLLNWSVRKIEYIPYPATWLRATDFDEEFEARADDKEPSLLESLGEGHFCKFCYPPHRHRCKDCGVGGCFGPKDMPCLEFLKTLKAYKPKLS